MKNIITAALLMFFSSTTYAEQYVFLAETKSTAENRAHLIIADGISALKRTTIIDLNGRKSFDKIIKNITPKDIVIALGDDNGSVHKLLESRGLSNITVINGGSTAIENRSISLLLDPTFFLKQHSSLHPNIKTLKTVLSSSFDNQYLSIIKQKASDLGLTIDEKIASTATESAVKWRSTIESLDDASEAILILDNSFLEEIRGLRYLLKTAWKRKIMVLSLIPKHVTKGVSMGIGQDFKAYGKELSEYAAMRKEAPAFFKTYSIVLNRRQLTHIGRYVSSNNKNDANIIIIDR